MEYFVVSDVHGYFKELTEALEKAGFDESNEMHRVIVIGDMFDRGPDSLKVYEYLKKLKGLGKAVIVKGNHELFILEVMDLNEKRMKFNIDRNGFIYTLNSFCGEDVTGKSVEYVSALMKKNNPELESWIEELPRYYETDNYLFVHAGFDPTIDWKTSDLKKMVWTKTREFRKLDLREHGIIKTVVHGHVSCRNLRDYDEVHGNDFSVYISSDKQKIGIDGSVMKTGRINVFTFSE